MGSGSSKPTPPSDPKKPDKKKESKEKLTDAQLTSSGFGTKPGDGKKK